MMIRTALFSCAVLFANGAVADDGVCKPLATLAKLTADLRDKGFSQEAVLIKLVREGKLDPNGESAPFVANTVVWVYEEKIPAQNAYKQLYAKCNRAFLKNKR